MGNEVSSAEAETTDGSAIDLESLRPSKTTRSHLLCLARAHNRFCLELYQEYAKEGKRPGNFVLAPVGISLVLGLLYIGAKGSTKNEIHRVLHLHEVTIEQLLPAFAALHWDVLKSTFPKGCVFEVALRLFAQTPIYLTPHYEEICLHFAIPRLKQADFRNRPDKARLEINHWAEEQSQSRIKDVVPMGIIERETKLLGLCGLYMKSQWLHPFDPKKTVEGSFHLPLKETLNVRMMVQHRMYRYTHYQKLDCEALEIPFANNFTRVLILLPKKQEGIQKLEQKIDRKILEAIYDSLKDDYVEVHFPKFRYELGLPIGDMLLKTGIKTMFAQGKADFSNINGSRDLYVSRIFHHVYMEFEEGAHSGPGSKQKTISNDGAHTSTSKEVEKKIFRCDHPFLFIIRDDRTGVISFLGRVARPLAAT